MFRLHKEVETGDWTFGTSGEEIIEIAVTNGTDTVYRYFPMDASVGVRETIQTADIKVYPNPANDELYLTFTTSAQRKIELSSAAGKHCLASETDGTTATLAIKDLTPGWYILRIWENGNIAGKFKVIKQY